MVLSLAPFLKEREIQIRGKKFEFRIGISYFLHGTSTDLKKTQSLFLAMNFMHIIKELHLHHDSARIQH